MLTPLAAHARAVVVHCQTSRELSVRRFIERAHQDQRHCCFFDGERIKGLEAGELPDAWERAEPVEIGAPMLRVDTTDGYSPDLESIVAFIHSAYSTGRAASSLCARSGDPGARMRMAAGPKLMTAEELLRLPRGRRRHELVRGELRRCHWWASSTAL